MAAWKPEYSTVVAYAEIPLAPSTRSSFANGLDDEFFPQWHAASSP
jgi:hypothetical protein